MNKLILANIILYASFDFYVLICEVYLKYKPFHQFYFCMTIMVLIIILYLNYIFFDISLNLVGKIVLEKSDYS